MDILNLIYESIIAESPDKIAGTGIHWTNKDAKTFFISDNMLVIGAYNRSPHYEVLGELSNVCERNGTANFPQLLKPTAMKGIYVQGDVSPIMDMTDRKQVLKLSATNHLNIMVGRVWLDSKHISFWNDITDCSINAVASVSNAIETVFADKGIDMSTFQWEIFDKTLDGGGKTFGPVSKLYTLEELEERLNNPDAAPAPVSHDHSALHTMMPGKAKEAAMMQQGFRKSPPRDIRNRPTHSGD